MRIKQRTAVFVAMILMIGTLSGCGSNQEEAVVEEPDIMQIRNICNLATLECYYHNVARSVKEREYGITHIGEKDRVFWIEYTGVTKLGIDMSKVTMEIHGTDVKVTLPKAEVLNISVDENSFDENSYLTSNDAFNKNKITADDQTEAISKAQEKMEAEARSNTALLLSAQNRAKTLIENYINQLGEASGVEYKIEWVYLEE